MASCKVSAGVQVMGTGHDGLPPALTLRPLGRTEQARGRANIAVAADSKAVSTLQLPYSTLALGFDRRFLTWRRRRSFAAENQFVRTLLV